MLVYEYEFSGGEKMEENKMFDLLEKIYIEVKMNNKRLDTVESEVKKLGAKIDGEVTLKQDATLDGYKQSYEILNDVKIIVSKNTDSIDEINMSISEMKEDINFIAGKTIRNDSKIEKLNKQLKAVK